jgi:error-prone DNA polymerase
MTLLASANALHALTGNRREAMWSAAGSLPGKDLLKVAPIEEAPVQLAAPSEAENMLADYRHVGLTLGRHPIAFLRERLHRQRFIDAADLATFSNGQLARLWSGDGSPTT